ncbi:MAG: hypothetical protein HGJ97_03750 [Desulfosporosinus sp.]|nr:hypothetical protein [Desulfosporosinus sp.]
MRSKHMVNSIMTGSVALASALALFMFPRRKKNMLMRRSMNLLTKGRYMLLKRTKLFH